LILIKQDPITFESFVAEVFDRSRGGIHGLLLYGVDFEHETKEGKFLGQVKCYKDDLDFEEIAILHSYIIK
jgi:restriction system protein